MATRTVSVEEFFGQQGGQQPTGQVQQPQPVRQQQPQQVQPQAQQDSLVRQQQRTITGDQVEDRPTMTADEFFSEGERPIIVDPEEESEKLNFLERVQERWSERGNMASEIEAAMARGEQGFAESAFQLVGKVGAGGVLDVLGEGVVSAFRGASAITPDIIEKPLTNAAKGAGLFFLDTPLGQAGLNAANEGIENYEAWKEENPRAARNVEAVVDIGLLAAPVRTRTNLRNVPEELIEEARQADNFRQFLGTSGTNNRFTSISKKQNLDELTPSQTGEDLFNPTSEALSQGFGIRVFDDLTEEEIRLGRAPTPDDFPPIIVDSSGKIIDGHNRFAALRLAGENQIRTVNRDDLLDIYNQAKGQTEAGTLQRAGAGLERRAAEQRVENRDSFLLDLVREKQTPTVAAQQAGRTTERTILGDVGPARALRRRSTAASAAERAMVSAVSKIDDVSPRNSTVQNFQAIQEHNRQLARTLEEQVSKNDFTFPKRQLSAELRRKKDELAESPVLVGDAEKTAQRLIETFERFVKEEKGTGSGLLKARKRFDREIERQKPKAFDPKTENAMSVALREIRQTANDFLDRNTRDVDVKESLSEQSNLFRAMDNMAPKIGEEANSAIMRGWQRVTRILGIRNELVQTMAGAAGIGGLGAAALFAPFVRNLLIGAGAVYGAQKLITSPLTKDFLAKLIKGLDASIRKTTDNNLIQELRADRAAILELLQTMEEADEQD